MSILTPKNRWQILQDCRLTCQTVTDETRLYLVIQTCMVLHNLLVETWKDSLTTFEVEGVMNIDGYLLCS